MAGGKSGRMGRDKAMLPWGDSTLLQHVINIVREVTDHVIVVADSSHKYSLLSVKKVVGDEYPGVGPLAGIITGLNSVESGYHYVLACDLPCINSEVLRMLMRSVAGYAAAVPCVGNRLEPLCAVYHKECVTHFIGALELGADLSVHGALSSLNLNRVTESDLRTVDPDLRSFINLNTLEEYGRINPCG